MDLQDKQFLNRKRVHSYSQEHSTIKKDLSEEDDEPIEGITEFNPFYIKKESFSPEPPSFIDNEQVQSADGQVGRGGFKVSETKSAHASYLRTITLVPRSTNGHLINTLAELADPITEHLTTLLDKHHGIKVYLVMDVEYESISDPTKQITDHLHTHFYPIFSEAEFSHLLESLNQELIQKNENFVQFKSGLVLKKISGITMNVAEHDPLAGKGCKPLPPFLQNKKCIINVNNTDNRCFGYALLAFLEPANKGHISDAYSYNQHFAKHHLDTVTYPVKPADIPATEDMLPFAINVFGFSDDIGRSRYPIYVSRKTGVPMIDLLYWSEHYALIKDFNRFMYDITKDHNRKHFCRRCFGHFWRESNLLHHQKFCEGFNGCKTNIRMPPENSICEFKNIKNQMKCPFVVYGDFECMLPQNPNQDADRVWDRHPGKTVATQQHKPFAVGFKLIGPDLRTPTNPDPALNFSNIPYENHIGENSAEWFLMRMMKTEAHILEVLFDDKRLVMTEDDTRNFDAATKCHICEKGWELDVVDPLAQAEPADNLNSGDHESGLAEEEGEEAVEDDEPDRVVEGGPVWKRKWEKVRDHDHLDGKYRGAAHNYCNLMFQKQFKIPVFFHNLKNYDGHLIVKAMEHFPNYKIQPIAQGLEKYLIIAWGKHIVFKDSLQFMATSLVQLAANLLKKGREQFVHLQKEFANETPEKMGMILRKGIYPYDFMCSFERLKHRVLPSRQKFFNKLKQTECSVEDYAHAQTVWREFGCRDMKDYTELYLKTDVLILADVFEAFRVVGLTNFGLDPAHYVSAPQFSWDAMLKKTKAKPQLISDPAMYTMISSGIRGGICMISQRRSQANHKRMGTLYNGDIPKKSIVYFDANNLYGYAMSQSLPFSGFRWMDKEEWPKAEEWLKLPTGDPIGYFVECDLRYPQSIHELHNEYPLAPERVQIETKMLSETQLQIRLHYNISHGHTTKLIPHLGDRNHYVLHSSALRFYMEHGLELIRVHRIIEFHQSDWMKPYVDLCSSLRAQATNDFEKDFFKIMVNSVYGKTVENQSKRTNIKIVQSRAQCKKLSEKPQCIGFRIFSEHLAAVQSKKTICVINKPFYVGFSVLDISKVCILRYNEYFLIQS